VNGGLVFPVRLAFPGAVIGLFSATFTCVATAGAFRGRGLSFLANSETPDQSGWTKK